MTGIGITRREMATITGRDEHDATDQALIVGTLEIYGWMIHVTGTEMVGEDMAVNLIALSDGGRFALRLSFWGDVAPEDHVGTLRGAQLAKFSDLRTMDSAPALDVVGEWIGHVQLGPEAVARYLMDVRNK